MIRLAIAYNKMHDNGLLERLPEPLRGDAVPRQIAEHEAALGGRRGAGAMESGAVGEAQRIYARTERLLVRVRHAVLAAYDDPDDPRIDAMGALGVGANQSENQGRLENLAATLADPVARGEIALVPDLLPAALGEHAAAHKAINKTKGGTTADRQTGAKTLDEERADTREMLKRVKGFLISQLGEESLGQYGFGLPAPATRPRLKKSEPTPAT
ncbi:hypothetical protein DB32_003458 [Sandaracinus amylolyticus]|uniref:Uncharacterized protein n=1 Tax=Sandaracinus amylolyticus TaxID=927083 RepID=A0A0F6SF46_9BACT|nr:hypothetical protein DB32_003458 [Sandaracinus amylolyticus]